MFINPHKGSVPRDLALVRHEECVRCRSRTAGLRKTVDEGMDPKWKPHLASYKYVLSIEHEYILIILKESGREKQISQREHSYLPLSEARFFFSGAHDNRSIARDFPESIRRNVLFLANNILSTRTVAPREIRVFLGGKIHAGTDREITIVSRARRED